MNKLFKGYNFVVIMALITMSIIGCAKKPDKTKIVAQINNYQVTVDDFKQEAKMSIPGASNEQILQDIITKELLLQEAQKNSLDKNRHFMKEIENYWKQTLIKRLIFIKGEEFLASVTVSEDEVKAQYDFIAKEDEGRVKPFRQMSGQIREELKMRKAQALLDQWIAKLRSNAKIRKNDAVFNAIKFKKTDN